MITYKEKVEVILDGCKVGVIHKTEAGYVYYPQGKRKYAGKSHTTLEACKKSLEGCEI